MRCGVHRWRGTTDCARQQLIGLGNVNMTRPRRDATVKPPCQPGTRTIFSIVVRVDRALHHEGLTKQLEEFLMRAHSYQTYDELLVLAREYVAFDENTPRES